MIIFKGYYMRLIGLIASAALVFLTVTLSGCGHHNGNEFVGTWKNVGKSGWDQISIERNGDGDDFYLSHKAPNFAAESAADSWQMVKEPAVAQDGKLLVSGDIPYFITIDKSTGHLVMPGYEFERVK
ncbi:hypothetical protein [Robbsia andropogonis]|uniref:hypothetical protein n=2 Tax=Robbsia andropogonis TaxID=28092 RepID=UPI0020A1C78B|nr:hypothetical protein [Robbsia andropogonis]